MSLRLKVSDRVRIMEEALERIVKWHGEFPEVTTEFNGKVEKCSYGIAYGSNGERDFMREIARKALEE